MKERDLIYQITDPLMITDQLYFSELKKINNFENLSLYCGFDPTASSLHLGNLISIITLIRASLYGFKPIFLIGGATGLIGDPSGKESERPLLSKTQVADNLKGIEITIENVVKNIYYYIESNGFESEGKNKVKEWKIINNLDFYENMNIITFIRDYGKHFRMSVLLNKENVVNRLKSPVGLSFTEFSYQLLQAYDFFHLFQNHNCIMQVGGSDQWGNITNGVDLIKKVLKKQALGLTTPLLTTSSGQKFGKSEGNAVWINPEKVNENNLFQYFMNVTDADLEKIYKFFTFYSSDQINEILKKHSENPEKRYAQTQLSETMVKMLFNNSTKGEDNKFLFDTDFKILKNKSKEEIELLFTKIEFKYKVSSQQKNNCKSFIDLLIITKKTKSEIRREIEKGGVYINNEKINLEETKNLSLLYEKYLLAEKFLVVRFGKKTYYILEFEN